MTDFNYDLQEITKNINPNNLTPHLKTIVNESNQKKPRTIANLLAKNLIQNQTNPTVKEIEHKGQIHQIKYVNIDNLESGPWLEILLLLLHVSHGEAMTLIDSLFPEKLQLEAKAFITSFKSNPLSTAISKEIQVKNKEIEQSLDNIQTGLALSLAILAEHYELPKHPDLIKKQLQLMNQHQRNQTDSSNFKKGWEKSQNKHKYQDKEN